MIACSVRTVMGADDTAGAENEGASTAAETAPHGPPSQSIIIVAQESNAIPTGPSITQAMRTISATHRDVIAAMIAREVVSARCSPANRLLSSGSARNVGRPFPTAGPD